MRIGLIMQLHGRPDDHGRPSLTWADIQAQLTAAEAVGFDSVVFEDGLLYPADDGNFGVWESVSVAGAIAAATSSIDFGPSVFNAVYRSPAMLAKIAETLDEISGGRFILGIGAGNTPLEDYQAFGFPTDYRFSRFAEAIEIIHSLVKNGNADFHGDFWSANGAELVSRGPRPDGPPIVIAAGGPKMLRLAARYADEWNWWTQDPPLVEGLQPLTEEMDRACEEVGRDRTTLRRSVDVYSVDVLGVGIDRPVKVGGTTIEIAEALLALSELEIDEVRCDLVYEPPVRNKLSAIEAMAEVISTVQRG